MLQCFCQESSNVFVNRHYFSYCDSGSFLFLSVYIIYIIGLIRNEQEQMGEPAPSNRLIIRTIKTNPKFQSSNRHVENDHHPESQPDLTVYMENENALAVSLVSSSSVFRDQA